MPKKQSSKKRIAGGAATGAGINYQAAVTAIAYVSMARGHSLSWLSKITEDIPVAVEAETGGSGDDIRLNLKTGDLVEVQVKKGLQKGSKLWEPLLGMAKAISNRELDYGVLVVSPTSSGTIKSDLAKDVIRLGDGRTDNLSAIAEEFRTKLNEMGLSVRNCCSHIRIQTVNALTGNNSHILAAQSELGHICDGQEQIAAAWNSLYTDATHLIEQRGRRELPSVLRALRADRVRLKDDTNPIQILDQLCNWTHDVCERFSIIGARHLLPVDEAWVPLRAVVQKTPEQYENLADAINKYQAWHKHHTDRDEERVNPETLARFHPRVVLIGGPGMGKTTLLKRIARRYSEDLTPTLRLRLILAAARMREGYSFEESIFKLGLDGSGIDIAAAKQAAFTDWLLLCDGLDECGKQQEDVASGISQFAIGHPRCRIIITTRPIGYDTAHFSEWRHYNIAPFEDISISRDLAALVTSCKAEGLPPTTETYDLCSQELENESIKDLVTRTPLLLGLAASLLARGESLGTTRQSLYDQIFKLIDEAPNSRTPTPPRPSALLRHFLNLLGWEVTCNPLNGTDDVAKICTTQLSQQMGTPLIQAEMDVEACLQYWQDVGMIEKVGIENEKTFVFIHKTFGEFAAARYLNNLPPKEQSQTIGNVIEQKDWTEVIRFAASSGLGDQICNNLTCKTSNLAGSPNVALSLEMLAIATPPPSEEVRSTIIQAAVDIVSSVRRPLALEAGKHLIEVARRFPEEVGPSITGLLNHHQSWTSLIGWAAAVAAEHYSVAKLPTAMMTAVYHEGEHHRRSLSVGVLDNSLEQDILESFILEAAAVLLRTPPKDKISLVKNILKAPDLDSVGFAQKATKLLERLVSQDESAAYSREIFQSDLLNSLLPDIYIHNKASQVMFESICKALDVKPLDDQALAKPKPLLELSAFMYASHMMEIEASDIYSWLSPHQKEATRETLLGFISVSGLNRDKLIEEIQLATSYIKKSEVRSIFELITSVDAPEPNWGVAPTLNLDASRIEAALHHPSRWIIILATYLTNSLLSDEKLEFAIQRIFSTGKGQTLWAASKLTSSLPPQKAAALITERLLKPLIPGCEYLFSELIEIKHDYDTNSDEILRNGLFSTALIAEKAAKYAASIASPGHTSLFPIIKDAYAYWVEHEEPYPTEGGVVPHSPRADLLKASFKIEQATYGELKSYINDPRRDVSDIAQSKLIEEIREAGSPRTQFLNDIFEGELPPQLFRLVDKKMEPFDQEELAACVKLIKSESPKIRFHTMSVLENDLIPVADARFYAEIMTSDPEQEIRDRAYRYLDNH